MHISKREHTGRPSVRRAFGGAHDSLSPGSIEKGSLLYLSLVEYLPALLQRGLCSVRVPGRRGSFDSLIYTVHYKR